MRRHPALEQLSRDHHHALVVARGLKRADEGTARQARDSFRDYWDRDGRLHFREEEEILLPACARVIDPAIPIVAAVLTDHVWIRRLADELSDDEVGRVPVLRELGTRLEQHIRLEERELFPLIERSIPEEDLRRLADALGS